MEGVPVNPVWVKKNLNLKNFKMEKKKRPPSLGRKKKDFGLLLPPKTLPALLTKKTLKGLFRKTKVQAPKLKLKAA